MIHSLIFSLGLKVMFIENFNKPWLCGYYEPSSKIVSVNLASYCDKDETVYEEVGHAAFLHDDEVKEMISHYQDCNYYPPEDYPTADDRLNERVADYFIMYVKYSDFPDKFPEIKKMFDRKVDEIIKRSN